MADKKPKDISLPMEMYHITQALIAGAALLSTVGSAAPATPDVRGHWPLEDGAGHSVADTSGNGNAGHAERVTWVPGVHGSGLRVGDNAVITCGNASVLCPRNALTIEAWVKPKKLTYNDRPTIISKQGSYEFRFVPGGRLSMLLTLEGESVELLSNKSEWESNAWVHLAGTYDGSNIALYVDGRKDAAKTLADRPRKIDTGNSQFCIGSVLGKSPLQGEIDEIRLLGSALSREGVKSSYDRGRFEIERTAGRFADYLSKKQKRKATAVIPGFLWIEAEDFDNYGGWWMDTQFVPQMGSPYLIAAGMGTPVEDAGTTVTLPLSGNYRLWTRTRNWLPDHSPGRFRVTVGGINSGKTFGTDASGKWTWQKGGTFALEKGDTDIVLTDLTGFYGRCDALIFTTDLGYTPPDELEAYKQERARLTGEDTSVETVGDYDVIVVGAGVAGCNAAIAAARGGAKTALIQNRPMLGGNNSLELGVPVSGPANWGKKNARAGGLNEEITREKLHSFCVKWSQAAEVVAAREENLTIFLNTHVNKVETGHNRTIKAVRAFDMITGRRTRYTADVFVDCTGDGWVGYYAGAEYMQGREARNTFNESNAPHEADNITMSGCLMSGRALSYASYDTGSPSPYNGPEWLWDLSANTRALEARKHHETTYKGGKWWHENRGEVDDLWDPESARDGLIRLSLSHWNWIKNYSNLKEKAANQKLRLVPINNAKRETLRLVGDHILTQNEVLQAKLFHDRIGHGGWGLDIHHPEGIFSREGPFDYNTRTPIYSIPYRILYSKNVPNLLFAGRNVSTSHVALGTLRVQDTTGIMGQAAGTAAGLCAKHGTTPREIYKSHLTELQQQLLKDDQYIIEMKNEDPADLARHAAVTASSTMPGYSYAKSDVVESVTVHALTHDRAVMFRRGAGTHIRTASLLLVSANAGDTELTLRLRGASEAADYSSARDLASATATVRPNSKSWVDFDLDCDARTKYLWLMLPRTEGISWPLSTSAPVGVSRAYRHGDEPWHVIAGACYAFHLDTPIEHPGGFGPANINNGVSRTVGIQSNMWRSDPSRPMPQWIQLDLGRSTPLNSIYLTFDTDMNEAPYRGMSPPESARFKPTCVRDYSLSARVENQWVPLVKVKNNYQRRRIHRFDSVRTSKVRAVVEKTNGDPSARIFEVRLYDE